MSSIIRVEIRSADGVGPLPDWTPVDVRIPDGVTPPSPTPTPPTGEDMIDFSQAVITRESPDVRGWPITAKMESLTLSAIYDSDVHFSKRNGPSAWPFVPGPEGGDLQYTLWVGCFINNQWYFSGPILCISRGPDDNYCPTGPTLKPGQLPENWYYYAGEPLASYQPSPGERVAWLVTAGVQRRNDIHFVAERSNVVMAPFIAGIFRFWF